MELSTIITISTLLLGMLGLYLSLITTLGKRIDSVSDRVNGVSDRLARIEGRMDPWVPRPASQPEPA